MTITFAVDPRPAGTFAFPCTHDRIPTHFGPYRSLEAAQTAANEHALYCPTCRDSQPVGRPHCDPSPTITLPTEEALPLLDALSYPTETAAATPLTGKDTAAGFLGRALIALALDRDAAAVTSSGPDRPAEAPPSDAPDTRLAALADLATAALHHERDILWHEH
jgi:hypothetical protein